MLQTFCGISENWTPRVWIEQGASLNALQIQECRGRWPVRSQLPAGRKLADHILPAGW